MTELNIQRSTWERDTSAVISQDTTILSSLDSAGVVIEYQKRVTLDYEVHISLRIDTLVLNQSSTKSESHVNTMIPIAINHIVRSKQCTRKPLPIEYCFAS